MSVSEQDWFMEFLGGSVLVLISFLYIIYSIKSDKKIIWMAGLWLAIAIHIFLIFSFFLNWAYYPISLTPWQIARTGGEIIILPPFLSLLLLLLLLIYRKEKLWMALFLNIIQIIVFFPVLLIVESNFDTSLLNLVSILNLFGSPLAAFLFVPACLYAIPRKGSYYYNVAFSSRIEIINAIKEFANINNLTYIPPKTLLHAGEAKGVFNEIPLRIHTNPSFFPPSYQMVIEIENFKNKGTKNFIDCWDIEKKENKVILKLNLKKKSKITANELKEILKFLN